LKTPVFRRRTPKTDSCLARSSASRRLGLLAASVVAAIAGALLNVRSTAADTIGCDSASLISAITTANGMADGGTVSLAPGCTYTLTTPNNNALQHGYNALPEITGNVTIEGNGATIERSPSLHCTSTSRSECFRFFFVSGPARLEVDSLTFSNGASEVGLDHPRGGGAILNRGRLVLTRDTFINNNAMDPNTAGGGAVENHDSGRLTVFRCTFIQNKATQAGALMDDSTVKGGYATITQSTFIGNQSTMFDGGAVEDVAGATDTLTGDTFMGNQGKGGAAIYSPGTMSIDDSTFVGNVAGTDGGGAIQNAGHLTITRSTLSGNSSPYGATIHTYYLGGGGSRPVTSLSMSIVANGKGGDNCSGTDPITDSGYNIDTGSSCFPKPNHTLINVQPQLEAPALNGGATQTMAVPSSSPAVNAVPAATSGCTGLDQRHISRPQGGGCDIGAYEMIITTGDSEPPTVPTVLSASSVTAGSITLTWYHSRDEMRVTGYTVYRNGIPVGATGAARATTFTDTSVAPSTAYTYTVDAFDGSGNHSSPSSPLSVTTLAPAAIVPQQSGAVSTGARVMSMTFPLGGVVHAGDLLVGWFGQYDAAGTVQVSDNVNGAWTRSASTTFSSGKGDIALYYVQNSAASPVGITVTVSASATTYLQASVGDYGGVASAGALDQALAAKGVGNAVSSGPTVNVAGGELVVGGIITGGDPGSVTPGSSNGQYFTTRAENASESVGLEDILSSSAGAQQASASLGTSTDWYAVVAVFRPYS
jgi:predicted outer membrane repeat protein